MGLGQVSDFLESYNGRDKILRLLYYGSQCFSGLCSNSAAKKIDKLSEHISECRTFLRLFDDIPMLSYTLSYGLGKEEPDALMQLCGIAANVFDQLYYPFEHIAWAADKGLVNANSNKWWTLSTACWVFSIYISLCKSLRHFAILQYSKQQQSLSEPDGRYVMQQLSKSQFNEILSITRNLCDLMHAIHWLPSGVLWSGQLKQWHIGALGMVSSVITLYQTFKYKNAS